MVRPLPEVSRKDPSAPSKDAALPLDFFVEGGENLNFWDLKFPLCHLDFLSFIPSSEELSNFPFKDENTSLLSVFISDVLSASAVLLMSRLLPSSLCPDDFTCTGGENVN